MPVYTDQLGRVITLPQTPSRIVSLVPSQTELLYSLGLEQETVGITKFCVHPQHWFRAKTRVGGTKTVKADSIHQLQPDLIIANKEENVQEQVEALAAEYPVYISDVNTLNDAYDMMQQVGNITNTTRKAQELIHSIQQQFNTLQKATTPLLTAYLIWRDPYMTIGNDTFIHDLLTRCGFSNAFAHTTRYPVVTFHQLQSSGCRLLLLSTEPYPFKQQHIDELQASLPNTQILLVDGELFSWYGSRLLHAPAYMNALMNQVATIS